MTKRSNWLSPTIRWNSEELTYGEISGESRFDVTRMDRRTALAIMLGFPLGVNAIPRLVSAQDAQSPQQAIKTASDEIKKLQKRAAKLAFVNKNEKIVDTTLDKMIMWPLLIEEAQKRQQNIANIILNLGEGERKNLVSENFNWLKELAISEKIALVPQTTIIAGLNLPAHASAPALVAAPAKDPVHTTAGSTSAKEPAANLLGTPTDTLLGTSLERSTSTLPDVPKKEDNMDVIIDILIETVGLVLTRKALRGLIKEYKGIINLFNRLFKELQTGSNQPESWKTPLEICADILERLVSEIFWKRIISIMDTPAAKISTVRLIGQMVPFLGLAILTISLVYTIHKNYHRFSWVKN